MPQKTVEIRETDKKVTLERMTKARKIARIGIWDQYPVSGELWWSDETYHIPSHLQML